MKIFRVANESGGVLCRLEGQRFVPLTDEPLEDLLTRGIKIPDASGPSLEFGSEDFGLSAPIRPGKIVAIGLNYRDHIQETGLDEPEAPLVFTKFTSSVIGPDAPIVIDRSLTERVDWEVELGVILGKPLSRASEDEAMEAVFGYTVANDVSARDVQFSDGQWIRGKSMDTFCPLGPSVVTVDEIDDPQDLRLMTRINGETVQDSSTSEMIFGVADLLSYCSQSFTLEPGDLVLTGTPWGCGEFMEPRRSLERGDVVEVEIPEIGVVRNPVTAIQAEPDAR